MAKESKFKKLSGEIQRKEGISKKKADADAAAIGFKKYGKSGMEEKAEKGRERKAAEKKGK